MKKSFLLEFFMTCILMFFPFVFTNAFSTNISKKSDGIFNTEDLSYFQLAKALHECGDLSSSLRTLNFIIVQKESNQLCDELYFEALYMAMSIYPPYEKKRINELVEKSQIQNHPALSSKIENGYLIIENIPPDMLDEENCDWIKEILAIFGMELAQRDARLTGNSFTIKLPPCGCCCKNPSLDAP